MSPVGVGVFCRCAHHLEFPLNIPGWLGATHGPESPTDPLGDSDILLSDSSNNTWSLLLICRVCITHLHESNLPAGDVRFLVCRQQ